jgi:hypothetical protein
VFIKRPTIRKDGKVHAYYSLCESVPVARNRTVQRRLLNLGELNSTQFDRWQHSVEVFEESGHTRQMRLFTNRDGGIVSRACSLSPERSYGGKLICWNNYAALGQQAATIDASPRPNRPISPVLSKLWDSTCAHFGQPKAGGRKISKCSPCLNPQIPAENQAFCPAMTALWDGCEK